MTRGFLVALAALVSIAAVSAALQVNVTIGGEYVREGFVYTGPPGRLSFELPSVPASVATQVPYSLNGSTLLLNASRTPLVFSALFKDLIVAQGSKRVLRTSFSSDEVGLSVRLPRGAALEQAVPTGELSTDGESVVVTWPPAPDRNVAVFYTEPSRVPWLPLIAFSLPVITVFVYLAVAFTRRRTIEQLLSGDEQRVLDLVDGSRTQQAIAEELGFSKSKMSKVVRKLEEKGLVGKEPHFKTNRLTRR